MKVIEFDVHIFDGDSEAGNVDQSSIGQQLYCGVMSSRKMHLQCRPKLWGLNLRVIRSEVEIELMKNGSPVAGS